MDKLDLVRVPVVDVHRENLKMLWPSIVYAIHSSSFIAIDAELSGLGNRRALMSKSMDDRYKSMVSTAKSRSIISLGLSCFQHLAAEEVVNCEDTELIKCRSFTVKTFNITLLCLDDYTVEADALQFLVGHGFDFNKQYSLGVAYYSGEDKGGEKEEVSIRHLFLELVKSNKSLVTHNGLVDLVFLYQNLYSNLPEKLDVFVADLAQMFPSGVYDTKCFAEYLLHMQSSYLEYLFRKMQRRNSTPPKGKFHAKINFPTYNQSLLPFVEFRNLSSFPQERDAAEKGIMCMSFANHGWCSKGHQCNLSHSVDLFLDLESGLENSNGKKHKKPRQRVRESAKRLRRNKVDIEVKVCEEGGQLNIEPNGTDTQTADDGEMEVEENVVASPVEPLASEFENCALNGSECHQNPEEEEKEECPLSKIIPCKTNVKNNSSTHRAGYDAFMTGYIMATIACQYGKNMSQNESFTLNSIKGFNAVANKVYLSGKDVPLLIRKSAYANASKQHSEKMKKYKSSNQ